MLYNPIWGPGACDFKIQGVMGEVCVPPEHPAERSDAQKGKVLFHQVSGNLRFLVNIVHNETGPHYLVKYQIVCANASPFLLTRIPSL